MSLRVLSLFAGIGGFDLGLERTGGFKTVAVAEINPFGARVLAERFPDAVNVGDVTTAEYPDADFIAAGFPCQDLSLAGTGAGLAGARSGLWREVVRAFRVVRPVGALLENVAALLGRGMGTVLGDLAEIGYDAEWHCIPASAVGAPHRRDRVWIIANPGSEQHEGCRPPISGEIAAELARSGVANAAGQPQRKPSDEAFPFTDGRQAWDEFGDGGQSLADTNAIRELQSEGSVPDFGRWFGDSGSAPTGCGLVDAGSGRHGAPEGEVSAGRNGAVDASWWAVEPDVGRVAHGVPARVDRLAALGNAVVPQIPELIGRAILASLTPPTREDR